MVSSCYTKRMDGKRVTPGHPFPPPMTEQVLRPQEPPSKRGMVRSCLVKRKMTTMRKLVTRSCVSSSKETLQVLLITEHIRERLHHKLTGTATGHSNCVEPLPRRCASPLGGCLRHDFNWTAI